MGRSVLRPSIVTALFLAFSAPAFGAPGELDPAFGDGGILRLELADFTNADTVTQLPSGRILIGGAIGETGQGGTRDFWLAHLTTSGDLDTAFDTDGSVADSIFDTGPEEIARFLVQPDGKVLVSGFGLNGMTFENIVARYNADGTPDMGFGTGGTIVPSPGFAIAEDAGGNILIGGNGASMNEFTLARYTPEGVLDTGFGSDGTLTKTLSPATQVQLSSVKFDAQGRIVIAAKADDVDAVARYLADGSPDPDFASGGFVYNFCQDNDGVDGMAFQSDGKIVVAARTQVASQDRMCLLRFTADGQIDNGFDTDGKVISDIPGVTKETPAGIAVMKDDRIVLGGEVDTAAADSAFFAARYEANGTPDTTFSGDGFAVFDVTPGDTDFGADVAVLNDGRVVVSGASIRPGGMGFFDATLVMFQGDVTDLKLTQSADRTAAVVGDGSPVVFTISVTNSGPLAAFGAQVTDSVPSQLTVASATSTVGTCSGGPNVVCDLGTLNPGDGVTVTVTATPAAAGSAINTAGVSGQIGDSAPDDNSASTTVIVSDAPSGGGTAGSGGSGGGCALVHDRPEGAETTVYGRISQTINQHITADLKKESVYIDLEGGDQIVAYVPTPLKCSGRVELTGKMIEVRGPEKNEGRETKVDDTYSEKQMDVSRWRCLATETDDWIERLADPKVTPQQKDDLKKRISQKGKDAIPALIAHLGDSRASRKNDIQNYENMPPNHPTPPPMMANITVGDECEKILYAIITPPPSPSAAEFRGKPFSASILRVPDWKKWWEKNKDKSLAQIHKELTPLVDRYWELHGTEQVVP